MNNRESQARSAVHVFVAIMLLHVSPAANAADAGVTIDPLLKSYLDDGCSLQVTIEGSAKKPLLNGEFQIATKSGAIVVKGHLVDGEFDGDLMVFDENRTLLSLARYSQGIMVGQQIEWDTAGWMTRSAAYDNEGNRDGVEYHFSRGVRTMEMDWTAGNPTEFRKYGANGELVERLRDSELRTWIREQARKRAEGVMTAAPDAADPESSK